MVKSKKNSPVDSSPSEKDERRCPSRNRRLNPPTKPTGWGIVLLHPLVGLMPLPALPPVSADEKTFSYVLAHLRHEIRHHLLDYKTDPECHRARIKEIQAAIRKLQSPNAPDQPPRQTTNQGES